MSYLLNFLRSGTVDAAVNAASLRERVADAPMPAAVKALAARLDVVGLQ